MHAFHVLSTTCRHSPNTIHSNRSVIVTHTHVDAQNGDSSQRVAQCHSHSLNIASSHRHPLTHVLHRHHMCDVQSQAILIRVYNGPVAGVSVRHMDALHVPPILSLSHTCRALAHHHHIAQDEQHVCSRDTTPRALSHNGGRSTRAHLRFDVR